MAVLISRFHVAINDKIFGFNVIIIESIPKCAHPYCWFVFELNECPAAKVSVTVEDIICYWWQGSM